MQKVISAKARRDYTIEVAFGDGSLRLFDVKPYLNCEVFTELRDLDYFSEVTVVNGTVTWPNEQDIAPETLYIESELIN